MKKKLFSLLMVTALTASLVAGCGSNGDSKDKSSGSDRETKDVSELVIGEIEYSVIDDGGWAQSMHEGLVKACEDLGIDTKTNLLTMEEISEEDTSLIESTVEELVDEVFCDLDPVAEKAELKNMKYSDKGIACR